MQSFLIEKTKEELDRDKKTQEIRDIFATSLSYEEKIAEIIFLELEDKTMGKVLVENALGFAGKDYKYRDLVNLDGENGVKAHVKSLLKTAIFGGVPVTTFYKLIKHKIVEQNLTTLTEENYKEILFAALTHKLGDVNKDSYKGFILKQLFSHTSQVLLSQVDDFLKKYKNNKINLPALLNCLCEKIKPEQEPRQTDTDLELKEFQIKKQ